MQPLTMGVTVAPRGPKDGASRAGGRVLDLLKVPAQDVELGEDGGERVLQGRKARRREVRRRAATQVRETRRDA